MPCTSTNTEKVFPRTVVTAVLGKVPCKSLVYLCIVRWRYIKAGGAILYFLIHREANTGRLSTVHGPLFGRFKTMAAFPSRNNVERVRSGHCTTQQTSIHNGSRALNHFSIRAILQMHLFLNTTSRSCHSMPYREDRPSRNPYSLNSCTTMQQSLSGPGFVSVCVSKTRHAKSMR